MKKLNVGYINDVPFYIGFGGKEIQLLAYENYMRIHYKNEINIIKLNSWDKNVIKNIDIIHIFGSTKCVHNLIRALKSNHANLKIILSPNFYVSNSNILKIVGMFMNICPISNIFKYRKDMFIGADTIIVNSESEKYQLIKLYSNKIENKIKIIYNGIENDFNRLSNKNIFLDKFNIDAGYLLNVSFLDERKNTLRLIKAFIKTLSLHDKKLVIIGGYRFESAAKANETKILLKKYRDRIIHIEYIDRVKDLELLKSAYYNCYAHILPSILETPGISNLEAFSYGKPILVGECPPVKDYFKNNVLYCNPRKISDISHKIIMLVENYNFHQKENYSKFFWKTTLLPLIKIYND
jgi:glycosyltransferase involved in cell wall biosynthesis